MDWFDDILTLRLQTLATYAECLVDEPGRAYEADCVRRSLVGAAAVEVLRTGGRTRAAVVIGQSRKAMLGLQDTPGDVYCVPGDMEAQAWAGDTLVAWKARLDHSFVAILPPTQGGVLDSIEGRGYRLQALVLHGDPGVAFERLGGTHELREREHTARTEHGSRIEPLRSVEHVEELVEQRRLFFTGNPQVSPISTSRTVDDAQQARIDEFVRRSLLESMRNDDDTQFVVTRSDEVVGGFGLVPCDASPVWGNSVGVEVFLNPSAHGVGLGTLFYLVMLRRMLELEVRTFRGTTANPAVVHMSRRMGRRLRGWKIVRGQYDARPSHLHYPLI